MTSVETGHWTNGMSVETGHLTSEISVETGHLTIEIPFEIGHLITGISFYTGHWTSNILREYLNMLICSYGSRRFSSTDPLLSMQVTLKSRFQRIRKPFFFFAIV